MKQASSAAVETGAGFKSRARSMTPTARKLIAMLKENTGTHAMDSGGAGGRAWQKAAGRDFQAEAASSVRFSTYRMGDGRPSLDIEMTLSTFHYLLGQVTFDASMNKRWRDFERRNGGNSYLEDMERFPEWLEKRGAEVSGISTTNTSNMDTLLDRALQYVTFSCDGLDYILLQIHGGADIRGGYTKPVVFRCDDGFGSTINQLTIGPVTEEVQAFAHDTEKQELLFPGEKVDWNSLSLYWDYDGSFNWAGSAVAGARPLDEYPVLAITEKSEWSLGTLCVFNDGRALCPLTGGTLECWTQE